VTTRSAHDLTELNRQPRAAAGGAPVQAFGPARFRLALGTDQHLPTARHRSRPRHRTLVGVVGGAAASPARRSLLRLVGSAERTHPPRIPARHGPRRLPGAEPFAEER
jgi:hypothetical protein